MLGEVVPWLLRMLEHGMSLRVSRRQGGLPGKSYFLTSSEAAREAVQAGLEGLGISGAAHQRWLGIDYAPGEGAGWQRQAVRRARVSHVKQRFAKVRSWGKRLAIGRQVVRQGLLPAMEYGAACTGTAPGDLRAAWTMLRRTSKGAGPFRSTALAMALEEFGGLPRLLLAPLEAWFREAWGFPQCKPTMARAWRKQEGRQLEGRMAWRWVRGPAAATLWVVRQLGWRMAGPWELLDPAGRRIPAECPQDLMHAARDALREKQLRQRVQAKEERAGLGAGPWLDPIRSILAGRSWSLRSKNALRQAVVHGYPSQEALHRQGRAPDPTCPLCGTAVGTR